MASWSDDLANTTVIGASLAAELQVLGCDLLDLPIIADHRGNLSVIENGPQIGFDIQRVFFLYDVPNGAVRAGHAHYQLHEILIAVSGSFDVVLDDGNVQQRCTLNRAHRGLHVAPMVWRQMDNFSSNSVCLVLASRAYDEADYIRDHDDFRRMVAKQPPA